MTGRWVSPHVPNRAPAAEATLAVMIIKAPMRPDLPPAAAAKPQQTRASTQYRAMTIASGRSRACIFCHDHRPWQYASRGGGFDLHIADLCRNIRNASGRSRCRSGRWGRSGVMVQPNVRNRPETRIVIAITNTVARTATCRMRKVRDVPSRSFLFPPTGGRASKCIRL